MKEKRVTRDRAYQNRLFDCPNEKLSSADQHGINAISWNEVEECERIAYQSAARAAYIRKRLWNKDHKVSLASYNEVRRAVQQAMHIQIEPNITF